MLPELAATLRAPQWLRARGNPGSSPLQPTVLTLSLGTEQPANPMPAVTAATMPPYGSTFWDQWVKYFVTRDAGKDVFDLRLGLADAGAPFHTARVPWAICRTHAIRPRGDSASSRSRRALARRSAARCGILRTGKWLRRLP